MRGIPGCVCGSHTHLASLLDRLHLGASYRLHTPGTVIRHPGYQYGNADKGESVGCAGCPMAVGPTALAVEGQQTHHQHPKISQLTPPLYSKQRMLVPQATDPGAYSLYTFGPGCYSKRHLFVTKMHNLSHTVVP